MKICTITKAQIYKYKFYYLNYYGYVFLLLNLSNQSFVTIVQPVKSHYKKVTQCYIRIIG